MATLPFDVLFDPLVQAELSHEVDSDQAVEIGPVNDIVTVSLTSTIFKKEELVFGSEIEISRYDKWRELKDGSTLAKTKDPYHEWLRREFKIASDQKTISSGHSLVASCWPRGNAWTYETKFKPGWKGTKEQKPKPGSDVDDFRKLLGWLEALPFENWETRGGVLTAGLSRPKRMRMQKTRDAHKKSYTLMGTCEDFDKWVAYLKEHPTVRKLRSDTIRGTVAFGHANLAKTRTGKPPKLYESLTAEALAYLDVAIVQALAGDSDPSRWLGRPVVELVEIIYREYLNNANRREHRMFGGKQDSPFNDEAYGEEDRDFNTDDETDDDYELNT